MSSEITSCGPNHAPRALYVLELSAGRILRSKVDGSGDSDKGGGGNGRIEYKKAGDDGGAGDNRRAFQTALLTGLSVLLVWILDEIEALPGQAQPSVDTSNATVSLVVPAYNEEGILSSTLSILKKLQPAAHEIIVVDGGSQDRTSRLAKAAGVTLLPSAKGRSSQMNHGAAAATGDILCFVHADSQPPLSLVSDVRTALSLPRTVLGGFRTVIRTQDGSTLKLMTAHHLMKSHYLPAVVRPLSYVRGLRCLFGDQTMFCRAADFHSAGGFSKHLPIMEDADLCLRMHLAGPSSYIPPARRRRGRVVQIANPYATTSGRRLAAWGNLHATYVHFKIGLAWWLGASSETLVRMYHSSYTDDYR